MIKGGNHRCMQVMNKHKRSTHLKTHSTSHVLTSEITKKFKKNNYVSLTFKYTFVCDAVSVSQR